MLSVVYYYYGVQRYEQFLYRSVDCIGFNLVWFSYLFPSTSVSLWCYIYIYIYIYMYIYYFLFTSFSLPFIELSLVVLVLDLVD